jgi:hypothetical protein
MKIQLENIIDNLSETFGGHPWHGFSLTDLLQDVDPFVAFCRPMPHKHNIAELVAHICVWRQLAVEILNENYDYQVDISTMADFPSVPKTPSSWEALLTLLADNQYILIEKLKRFDASKLEEQIPQRPFTFRFLFEGIVFHDVYHGGQIGILKAAIFERDKTLIPLDINQN